MAPHSSTLAWKIPWTEEPGRLQSMGSLRVRLHFHFHALEKEMATHSSVLAWRIPGTAEPGGLPSMGSHRVGHDWSNLLAAAAGKNEIPRNELNQVGERPLLWILQTIDKGIWKWCKEMKRYHVSLDWENVAKMFILPKAIYRFNAIPIKISIAFFSQNENKWSNIFYGLQKTLNCQTILEKKEVKLEVSCSLI